MMDVGDVCKSLESLTQELRDLASKIVAEKKKQPVSEEETLKICRQGGLKMIELKRTCRESLVAMMNLQEQMETAKTSAEGKHLVLQNMLYEKAYILREIERCRKFERVEMSKIDLVAEEQFEKTAPKHVLDDIASLPEGSSERAHQFELSRLSHELLLRQELKKKLEELKSEKQKVKRDTTEQQRFLDELPKKMESIVKSTEPIQEHFGEPIVERLDRHEKCRQLPNPLYIIYGQLESYGDSFGNVSVTIEEDPVKIAWMEKYRGEEQDDGGEDDEDDDDEEEEEDDQEDEEDGMEIDQGSKKKKKKKNSSSSSSSTSKKKKREEDGDKANGTTTKKEADKISSSTKKSKKEMANGHKSKRGGKTEEEEEEDRNRDCGRAVVAKLGSPNKQVDVVLKFEYYPIMNLVTVEAVNYQGLLANIFPNDTGQYLPNSRMSHQSMGKREEFPEYLNGRPYKWLQWLAGIYNLDPEGPELVEKPSTRTIVEKILGRIGAQESLSEQLHALNKCPHPVPVHPSAQHLFPSNATTKLIKWEEITAQDADDQIASSVIAKKKQGIPVFHPRMSLEEVHFKDSSNTTWENFGRRCFHGVLQTKDKAKFETIVQVFVDYPARAPQFTLFPTSNSMLRIVESELNDYADELKASDRLSLLSHQLRRLQMCLDVLESASSSTPSLNEDDENNKNASAAGLERKHRGRDRRLPFVYDPATRTFIHR